VHVFNFFRGHGTAPQDRSVLAVEREDLKLVARFVETGEEDAIAPDTRRGVAEWQIGFPERLFWQG
jgi:hypothetical protein